MSKYRKLTKEEQEIYSGAVIKAQMIVPAFRDGIALLRPFYDETADTAYSDKYCRVGLSPWFFNEIDYMSRALVILHEVMHILNNHFARGDVLGASGQLMNIAGDFEINCGLAKLKECERHFDFAIFPDKKPFNYKRYLSMEQYLILLKEDEDKVKKMMGDDEGKQGGSGQCDGNCQPNDGVSAGEGSGTCTCAGNEQSDDSASGDEQGQGSGTGENKHCDDSTDERSAGADDAGVTRASESEKTIMKKNTQARIVEELKNKSRSNGHLNDFLTVAQKMMEPPKVSWQSILRRILSRNNDAVIKGRADYSYRRVNRRSHNSEFIFPGMVQYLPSVMFGVDTSGSMSAQDYRVLLNEIEGILKATAKGKDSLTVFSVDTVVENVKPVNNVREIKFQGGGGTDQSVAFKYVNSLNAKKRPDIFVLATDGYTDWRSLEDEVLKGRTNYRSVLLVTDPGGYNTVPESLKKLIPVIDISDKN